MIIGVLSYLTALNVADATVSRATRLSMKLTKSCSLYNFTHHSMFRPIWSFIIINYYYYYCCCYLFKLQMGFYPVVVYYNKTQNTTHITQTTHNTQTQHTKLHKQ
jgi:hypothetical protein